MKYSVIVADPPWTFKDKLTMDSSVNRGAETNYKVLDIDELCLLDVKSITEDDAFCCLWVPNVLLKYGLKLLESWSFDYKGLYVWGKKTKNDKFHFGMGHYWRGSAEVALFGRRGKIKVSDRSQRNIEVDNYEEDTFFKHSKKTEKLQDCLELMFPEVKKIELFARRKREGWECVGNECNGEDVRDSIKRLSSE
jgi:N6-adenosine-specific RNA methylase IME4